MARILENSIFVAFILGTSAMAVDVNGQWPKNLEEWITWTQPISTRKMLENISPPNTVKGVVVASPSKDNPDYYYHWVRDAGLVMDVIVSLYARAEGETKEYYRNRLLDFVDFSIRNQKTPNKSGGVGEPKFLVSGDAFNGDWGRPQNDSPAVRAIALIRWARILLMEGNYHLVQQKLYTGGWDSVIKTDLEYLSHHWQNTCYDLWEEIRGHHFFTRMVQRRALLDGADLAAQLGDGGAAFWYREQANRISTEILKHWNGRFLVSTLNRDGGIDYKESGIDSSVILGVLHGKRHDAFMTYADDRVMATAHQIEEVFQNHYLINQKGHRGTATGRYPEDRYNGYFSGGTGGNPWFINTNAMAQYFYELSKELEEGRSFRITNSNRSLIRSLWHQPTLPDHFKGHELRDLAKVAKKRGDDYLSCTQFHMAEDGSLSEQMNRDTGYMQGAHDLTWSYASLLTSLFARY